MANSVMVAHNTLTVGVQVQILFRQFRAITHNYKNYKRGRNYEKKEIIEILMRRDDLTREEAEIVFDDVAEQMQDAVDTGDYSLAEEILMYELGLEMDYIYAFI